MPGRAHRPQSAQPLLPSVAPPPAPTHHPHTQHAAKTALIPSPPQGRARQRTETAKGSSRSRLRAAHWPQAPQPRDSPVVGTKPGDTHATHLHTRTRHRSTARQIEAKRACAASPAAQGTAAPCCAAPAVALMLSPPLSWPLRLAPIRSAAAGPPSPCVHGLRVGAPSLPGTGTQGTALRCNRRRKSAHSQLVAAAPRQHARRPQVVQLAHVVRLRTHRTQQHTRRSLCGAGWAGEGRPTHAAHTASHLAAARCAQPPARRGKAGYRRRSGPAAGAPAALLSLTVLPVKGAGGVAGRPWILPRHAGLSWNSACSGSQATGAPWRPLAAAPASTACPPHVRSFGRWPRR